MPLRAMVCPKCGGPLPPEAKRRVVVCPHCQASVTHEQDVVRAAAFRLAFERIERESARDPSLCRLGGVPYRLLGHLGSGASTEVFLAERAHRITERVRIKVLRAPNDAELLAHEARVLELLERSTAPGAAHFTRRLPQVVALGELQVSSGESRPALALRQAPGYVGTFEQVVDAYPGGVDPRHAVWMWRRVLETLGWVHASGWVHGAVLPEHLLVEPHDHGVMLIGWSMAADRDHAQPPRVVREGREGYYPRELLEKTAPSPASDIAQSARSIAWILGGDPETGEVPSGVPGPLGALFRTEAMLATCARSAHELDERLQRVAREVFGPPRFVPFTLSGGANGIR